MAQPKERQDIKIQQERAVLAAVHLPDSRFDERDPLGELRALAENAGAETVGELIQNRQQPESGTFMGIGKLEELKSMCEALDAAVVIFDNMLSPKQIATIEKILERKVIDRCELILDIFAGRAATRQAKLAVELAQLEYTYPRLRAMWTHLERIVGSGGMGGVGTRGPGEQQIEIDRRLVQRRKVVLRRELEEIHSRKQREVSARKQEHYTIGLVGYTNAGKSTLFNTLTEGGAYADDRVFATLMSRTRRLELGSGLSAMLSDTVGFIRDLPHQLVASFRATLEEATHADLLLIVLDVSDPMAELQYDTVLETLDEIFLEAEEYEQKAGRIYTRPSTILLLNKADKLRDHSELSVWTQRVPGALPFCASEPDGMGQEALLDRVRALVHGEEKEFDLTVPLREGKAMAEIERLGSVLEREYEGPDAQIRVLIGSRTMARLQRQYSQIKAGIAE